MALDILAAKAFVAALTGDGDSTIVFQLADDVAAGPRRKNLEKVLTGTIDSLAERLGAMNDDGAAVWVQINAGRRSNKNVTALRACFIDDDGTGAVEPAPHLPPSWVVQTSEGARNRHYYWFLKEGEKTEDFTEVQKALIKTYNTDKSINNLDRCMRLPGSFNMKAANAGSGIPFRVTTLEAAPDRRYTLDELAEAHAVDPDAPTDVDVGASNEPKATGETEPSDEARAMADRIEEWLQGTDTPFRRKGPFRFGLIKCAFNPDHVDKMEIRVMGRGGVWAACFHDSCGGNINRWPAVKDKVGGWSAGRGSFMRGDSVEIADRVISFLSEGALARPVYAEGAVWRYDSKKGVWVKIEDSEQHELVANYAGCAIGKKKVLHVNTSTIVNAWIEIEAKLTAPKFFEEAPAGIAFANGFLDLSSRERNFVPNAPQHRQRDQLSFDYEKTRVSAKWFAYLLSIFKDDNDGALKMDLLQEFIGACLAGIATNFQKALVLHGSGANGKSVLTSVVAALFPSSVRSCVRPQDFGIPMYRAVMAGCKINVCHEMPESDILSGDAFKSIVSGDETTARQIYGRSFALRLRAGQLFSANRLPGTSDHSEGYWRRLLVITFNQVFEGANVKRNLAEELIATELGAIAAWAVVGAARLLKQNAYTQPPSSVGALYDWRQDSDPVARFLDECCAPSTVRAEDTAAGDLYTAFKAWCAENGHRLMTSTQFGRRLKNRRVGWYKHSSIFYEIQIINPPPTFMSRTTVFAN